MTNTKGTTADMVIVDEKGVDLNTEETLTTTVADDAPENNKAAPIRRQSGFRTIGPRKGKLLLKISDELQRLHRRGINSKYVLNKFTDFKDGIRTPTKKLSGILSQLKSFDK